MLHPSPALALSFPPHNAPRTRANSLVHKVITRIYRLAMESNGHIHTPTNSSSISGFSGEAEGGEPDGASAEEAGTLPCRRNESKEGGRTLAELGVQLGSWIVGWGRGCKEAMK